MVPAINITNCFGTQRLNKGLCQVKQKCEFECVHLHVCVRAGVLCGAHSPPPLPSPAALSGQGGDHPFKMFLYYTPPGSFIDALLCLGSLMRPSQPRRASQPIGEHLRSVNDLFFSPPALSPRLCHIFTELNLNHCLIYASCTSASAETMQVKTKEAG